METKVKVWITLYMYAVIHVYDFIKQGTSNFCPQENVSPPGKQVSDYTDSITRISNSKFQSISCGEISSDYLQEYSMDNYIPHTKAVHYESMYNFTVDEWV